MYINAAATMPWGDKEQEWLRSSFDDFAACNGATDAVGVAALPELLRSIGVIALRSTVEEALTSAAFGGRESLNHDEFKYSLDNGLDVIVIIESVNHQIIESLNH